MNTILCNFLLYYHATILLCSFTSHDCLFTVLLRDLLPVGMFGNVSRLSFAESTPFVSGAKS